MDERSNVAGLGGISEKEMRELPRDEVNRRLRAAGERRVQLPESVVEIYCNVQLKDGATWSTVLGYEETLKRVEDADEWVQLPCLVRRPTGKGEITDVTLRAREIVVLIDSHDFIDTVGGRPVDA